jgi:ribosome-binding protein aMBF1 (putative translation factor)
MRDYRERIGCLIRRERQDHGWSQNELARRMQIPEMTGTQISRWETGSALPNPRNFGALETALGVLLIPDVCNGNGD